MFNTSLDVLYIVLAVSVAVVSVFFSIFLYNVTRLVKQARTIGDNVEQLTQALDTYVRLPLKLLITALEKGKEVSQYFSRKSEEESSPSEE